MPAKRMRSSIVVAITTPPAPPLGMREPPASVALEFVTNEHRLIRSMIAEFLGRQGVREQEDLTQDLWMHLNGRLQRAIPRLDRRRSAMIAMTRNFLRNVRRRNRRVKRRAPAVASPRPLRG